MESESGKGDEKPHYEGQLLKFTNVMKGFQYRWFVVNNALGTFDYYEKEDQKKYSKPRGYISLIGAEVIPSAECPHTFLINSKIGTFFKLKALNTKERQEWINNLRKSVSYFTSKFENKNYFTSSNGSFRFKHDGDSVFYGNIPLNSGNVYNDCSNFSSQSHIPNVLDDYIDVSSNSRSTKDQVSDEYVINHEPFKNVASLIGQMEELGNSLARDIELLPNSNLNELTFCDKNLLLTKATSFAAVDSLKKCLNLLRNQKVIYWKIFNSKHQQSTIVTKSVQNVTRNNTNYQLKSTILDKSSNSSNTNDEFENCLDNSLLNRTNSGSSSSLPATISNSTTIGSTNVSISGCGSSSGCATNGNSCAISLSGVDTTNDGDCNKKSIKQNNSIDHITLPPPIVSTQSNEELNIRSMEHSISTKSAIIGAGNFLLPIEDMSRVPSNPIDLTNAIPDSPEMIYCRSNRANNESCSNSDDSDDIIEDIVDIKCREEHKTIIQHLIQQIKLGMDLTKVTLPSFLLEKRSLLEMFSDFMTHPDLFLKIGEEQTPEKRIRAVVLWYLTAFHAGKKSGVAKKPYNPIIGETFHCMWHVPTFKSTPNSSTSSSSTIVDNQSNSSISCHHVRYTAEQVSHHPPITALHLDTQSPSQEFVLQLNGSVHTRSKFQGMSVTAQMLGKLQLKLINCANGKLIELYQFTLPNAHVRNILSVPRLELGDKVTISCPTTKYSASIVFHSKNLFGNSPMNRISGEIKDPDNKIFVKITGDWDKAIELQDIRTEEVFCQKVADLPLFNKYVNKLEHQQNHESRKLWHHVTEAIKVGDMDKATKHKTELEIRQRQSEKARLSRKLPFPVKYFQTPIKTQSSSSSASSSPNNKSNAIDTWVFRNDLRYRTYCNIDH